MRPLVKTLLISTVVGFLLTATALAGALTWAVLGFGGIASLSFEFGKLTAILTLVAFVTFLAFLFTGRRTTDRSKPNA